MKYLILALLFVVGSLNAKCFEPVNDIERLACVIYFESGNQDRLGKQLVADTVINRINTEGFPSTFKDVIFQPNQYAKIHRAILYKEAFAESYWIAIITYFKYLFNIEPVNKVYWFHTKQLNNKCRFGKLITRHGNHVFCG